MQNSAAARWTAITVFVFSAVLNYLDRQVLATMVDIWKSNPEFPFSYQDYGLVLSVFSLAYALSAPFMGWFLDRVGLNRGIAISVTIWAAASFATAFAHSVGYLLVCRAILGMAEASGVSAVGKAVGMYLYPPERAVGTAMGQLGLSLGAGLAPHFAVYFAYQYNWRYCFYAVAILSLLWIPIWFLTSKMVPPISVPASSEGETSREMIRDRRIWAMVFCNATAMTIYSLWTNWTPTYLVKVHHLSPTEARNYSWIVPICGYFGAMAGGAISWRLIRAGWEPVEARKRVCLIASCLLVSTFGIPFLSTPALATMGMSISYFCIASWSANMYTIPVDLFGARRAAFGVGALLLAYGGMQAIISRPLGQIIEQHGFFPICATFAFLPVIAQGVMQKFIRATPSPSGRDDLRLVSPLKVS